MTLQYFGETLSEFECANSVLCPLTNFRVRRASVTSLLPLRQYFSFKAKYSALTFTTFTYELFIIVWRELITGLWLRKLNDIAFVLA